MGIEFLRYDEMMTVGGGHLHNRIGKRFGFPFHFADGFITGATMSQILNVALVTGVDGFAVLDTSSVKT